VDLGQSDLSVDLRFGRKRQGKGRGGWLTCRKMVVKLNGIEDCTDCTMKMGGFSGLDENIC